MYSFCVTQINASDNLKMTIGTSWTQNNLNKVAKHLGYVLLIDDTEETNE